MSNEKHKELAKTGQGPVGKVIVFGAKDRKKSKVVASTGKPTLQGFIADNEVPDAKVYTYDASDYLGIPFDHETVNHSVSEYVDGMEHTNGIDSYWAKLKWALKGAFHKLSAKHLQRYVNNFSDRHNDLSSNTIDIMQHVAKGMGGKQLPYKKLIAENGLSSGAWS